MKSVSPSVTLKMRRPATANCSPRATVSTSGSSGMFVLFAHVTILAAAAAPAAAMVHFLLGVLVHIASLRLFFITALFLALAASAQARKHETGFLDRKIGRASCR